MDFILNRMDARNGLTLWCIGELLTQRKFRSSRADGENDSTGFVNIAGLFDGNNYRISFLVIE